MDRRKFLFALGFLAGCATQPGPSRGPRPTPSNAPVFESIDALLGADADPRRTELVMMAISFLGVPYAFGGTSPERGFDCSGLVAYVYRRVLNQSLPRSAWEQSRVGESVPVPALRSGDLVFYNTLARSFSHVGMYIGGGRFIHAPATGGVVSIAGMFGEYWTQRFNGARRVIA